MRAIVTGDFHLERMESLIQDFDTSLYYKTYDKIVKYAENKGINRIFILGDVFHTPFPDSSSLIQFLSYWNKYEWLKVYVILGNHDFSKNKKHAFDIATFFNTEMGVPKNIKIFSEPEIKKFDGIRVCLLPHPNTKAPKTKMPKIVFGHFPVKGALGDNGYKLKTGESLKTGKDFWFLGDLHQNQDWKKISYPGSPYQLSFGESLPKGFLDIDVDLKKDKKNQYKLDVDKKWIKLNPEYKLETIKIHEEDDIDNIEFKSDTYYKVFVKQGVQLPEDFLNNKRIVNTPGFSNNKELSSLEENSIPLEDQKTLFLGPTYRLKDYLIGEKNLKPKDARTGKKVVRNIVNIINKN